MCGIAGAVALSTAPGALSEPLDHVVGRMAQRLAHRGPDGSDLWRSASGRICLAHRRLAIIDLTPTGRQPMAYGNRFWITFNGEIYNYKKLRSDLRALGHTFRGESDTEVLLGAIAQWGIDDALGRCVGMFAFAVWDEQEGVLHLARDRMGEKPLYLGEAFGHLFFASELRAFQAIPGLNPRFCATAAGAYLRDGCVPGRLSIYERIVKLPPGHIVTINPDSNQRLSADWSLSGHPPSISALRPRSYWSCRRAEENGRQSKINDSKAAIEQGEELIRQSVLAQMHADVPTGAFLSGGIDSSLVTAVMQDQSSQPIRTFTVAFDDPRFDESGYARAIANRLGTRHEEFSLREQEIVDQVPSIVEHMDEPTANGSLFPAYLISRLARTQVTVALSGDGGDELFAGYNRYVLAPNAWRRSRWVPSFLRNPIADFLSSGGSKGSSWLMRNVAHVGSQVGSADARRKLARVLTSGSFAETYLRLTSWWTDPTTLEGVSAPPPRDWPMPFSNDLRSMLLADQMNYLPDDNLAKVDRASMATSLETRLPLLDHRLVEFSWRLPDEMKLRGRTTKWLLREILDKYLPRSLIERPKMGFTVPIDKWLRGPLREWATDMIGLSSFHDMLGVRAASLNQLWSKYLAGSGPSANELWALVILAAWTQSVAPGASASTPTDLHDTPRHMGNPSVST